MSDLLSMGEAAVLACVRLYPGDHQRKAREIIGWFGGSYEEIVSTLTSKRLLNVVPRFELTDAGHASLDAFHIEHSEMYRDKRLSDLQRKHNE